MKKLASFILVVCVAFLYCATPLAASVFGSSFDHLAIEAGRLQNLDCVQDLVDDYFALRNLNLTNEEVAFITNNLESIVSSASVMEKEIARQNARDNLATYHGVHLVDSTNFASIRSAEFVYGKGDSGGNSILLGVCEWTWIKYNDGKGGNIDEMGYATEHLITVAVDSSGMYKIIEDNYDESEILGVLHIQLDEGFQDAEPSRVAATAGVNSNTNVNYAVNSVVDYADAWVIHEYASNMQNPSYYNLATYGYYSADCANYTSQCMRAGGMVWDYGSGKDSGNWDGTQWWFDINPNPNYENYNVSPASWRYVPKFITYWENQGYARVSATASSVYPGNPVINNTGHVGICVGYNSSGTPIINAHNRDVYHVPYTMIGTGTRTTIQVSTTNKMVNTPANATSITPTTMTQITPLKYLSLGENHYYSFTVANAGYYTFESTYYNNIRFDTRAFLYKESQASNGQTLYMYEIARDDDGGEDLNFRMTAYLTAGKYYLRVRPYSHTTYGYYYLEYRCRY